MRNIYLYPVFEDKASFDDVMSRAAWYFEPWLPDIAGFHVATAFEFDGTISTDPRLDPKVIDKVGPLLERTVVHNSSAASNSSLAREALNRAELLLVWRLPSDESERAKVQSLLDGVRARGWLSYVVDKDNEMSHGCNWLWGSISLASREARATLKSQSYDRLVRWAAQLRSSRAYVLGTGPNLEQVAQRDFSDGDCIIANSIIKNKELMKRLDPVAVCACDPIFHAGVSLYAAEFRQTLVEAMDEYPRMHFFAPHRDENIYLLNLPERLHERCIFVPIDTDPGTPWNCDLGRNFYLVPEGNVLTQMMLPIAAAFHEKISVIGCDGRPLQQNNYFWSHHKASQFNDQMQNIQEVHPAFFALRDYDDHYAEHCADTARIITNIEERGKRVDNLTDSYIPALAARNSLDQRSIGNDLIVVSINPNLRNRYGHLLGYDEGMREAVRAAGGEFLTLGSTSYDGAHVDLNDAQISIEQCFSDNVYAALTRLLPDVDQDAIMNFEREFEAAVIRHKREHPDNRFAYYLYMGSLPHAVALANVCVRHPEVSATVNTFGECMMDCMRDGHIDQWTAFLQSTSQQRNFSVLAITPQLQREVRARCAVDLPLCAHPTGAFSDSQFAAQQKQLLSTPLPQVASRLIFPGGFWGEKNFDLTCDIARRAHATGMSCVVRTGPLESANRQQLAARQAILPFARTADGVLGDDEYRAIFADADIAVLTYRRDEWRIRNSSVVIDCLYAGLPMIVVAGTWLGELVSQYGCGEVVDRETPEAFMEAISRIRAAYATYRRRTIAAARAYYTANSFADVVSTAIHPIWADPEAPLTPYDPGTIPAKLHKMRASALGLPPPARNESQLMFDSRQKPLEFELTRDADCMFEELAVALQLLSNRDQAGCVMIDVGAHSGGSFPRFIDAGWTVHAFEPDPSNRAGIPKRYLDNPRFMLDARALSDKVQNDVPFFTSTESTGISGLSAFHVTHAETARVSTTTLADVIAEREINSITLLKVDTEGFDLFVLKGMAWDKVLPDIVITEFENAKTEKLGYTLEDQIRFLEERGYTVFVSEWWPIVRYGIRHHWRSLYPASQKRPDTKGWGNFIAFRTPPNLNDLYKAMFDAVDLPADQEARRRASEQLGALRAQVRDESAKPSPARTAAAAPLKSVSSKFRQRMTPGRKRLVQAGGAWGAITLALTAMSVWLSLTSFSNTPLHGATIGAASAGWFGVVAGAFASLIFVKRRSLAGRLSRMPGVIELLRQANALQRRRRPEVIVSAQILGIFALLTGSVIGAAAGAISIWIWAPMLCACLGVIALVCSGWFLALLLALIRSQAEDVAALRYDRAIALMQSDGARMQREISQAQSEAAQLASLPTSFERLSRNISDRDNEFRSDILERLRLMETAATDVEQRFKERSTQIERAAVHKQNKDRFLNFNRRLNDESIGVLSRWAEKLAVPVPAGALPYMAHRIDAMETIAHGRLAASVETQILRNLIALSVRRENFEGMEIGTLYGLGAASLIEATSGRFKSTRMTIVDPFSGYYARSEDPLIGLDITREQFVANMRRLDIADDRYRIVHGFSEDEATIAAAGNQTYQYLLIDGDHSYEGVRRDYENYAPMVERYGYILIDDYGNAEYEGIQRFVDETLRDDDGLLFIGAEYSTAIFRVWRPTANGVSSGGQN